ncbi:creatininase [Acidiphilium acidophilum]|nr:creatininase [Acidiphilium acidophilum]
MSIMMNELSWPEYRQRILAGAVVFLPVGATEQHGHHMPLGVDVFLPMAISKMIAKNLDGLVAPGLAYGYKSQPRSGGGNHYIGTTSLSAASLIGSLKDVLLEFARHGCRKLVIMNGHYENAMFEVEAIDLALQDMRCRGVHDFKILKIDYFEFIPEKTLQMLFPDGFPGWALEHAAVFETSLMLHFHPELVHMDRLVDEQPANFPPYDVYPTNLGPIPPSGVLSKACSATAAKGLKIADDFDELITMSIKEEFGIA